MGFMKTFNLFAMPFAVMISTLLGIIKAPNMILYGGGFSALLIPVASQFIVAIDRFKTAESQNSEAPGSAEDHCRSAVSSLCGGFCRILADSLLGFYIYLVFYASINFKATRNGYGMMTTFDDDAQT